MTEDQRRGECPDHPKTWKPKGTFPSEYLAQVTRCAHFGRGAVVEWSYSFPAITYWYFALWSDVQYEERFIWCSTPAQYQGGSSSREWEWNRFNEELIRVQTCT